MSCSVGPLCRATDCQCVRPRPLPRPGTAVSRAATSRRFLPFPSLSPGRSGGGGRTRVVRPSHCSLHMAYPPDRFAGGSLRLWPGGCRTLCTCLATATVSRCHLGTGSVWRAGRRRTAHGSTRRHCLAWMCVVQSAPIFLAAAAAPECPPHAGDETRLLDSYCVFTALAGRMRCSST